MPNSRTHRDIIHELGGYRRLSEMLSLPLTTVQSWQQRGRIPAYWYPKVLQAACAAGVRLQVLDLINSAPPRGRKAA